MSCFRRMRGLLGWAAAMALPVAASAQVLLIPDSTNDVVHGFDPYDGHYLGIVIPFYSGFSTPINAIDSTRGTIFVSDQVADAVYEFDYSGNYIGTVISGTTSGVDNMRGIAVRDGYLYVTIGSGTWVNTIQRFDLNGGSQSTWAGAPIDNAFDIFFRANDALVASIDTDDIDRFDLNGNWLGKFVDSDGVSNIDFPEQVQGTPSGNILAAGFSAPIGVYEWDSAGNPVGYYAVGGGNRGVYELGNGKILWTDGDEVSTYDRGTGAVETMLSGASFRFIELVPVPEPGSVAAMAVGLLALVGLRRRR